MTEVRHRKSPQKPRSGSRSDSLEQEKLLPNSPELKARVPDHQLRQQYPGKFIPKPAPSSSQLRKAKVVAVLLTFLAFLTRFWLLNNPTQVVFDEVHFGKFASYYLRRSFYFDVHPPLGRLMLGGTGYLAGYDGSYLFDKIGEDYISREVPYVAYRSVTAMFGALLVPLVFFILYETDHSLSACVIGAAMTLFDNALVCQTRLILLDSFLLFFDIFSVYAWIKFYKQRFQPFSWKWWLWMLITGSAISMATGVKMVGLFVVGLIGLSTIMDLWRLIDYRRGLSVVEIGKHFFARVLGLIIVPILLYLAFFAIHFAVLKDSGPGDVFMTPSFQSTLNGSRLNKDSLGVYYGANVTMMHYETSIFLHSHAQKYPLRYQDDRVSSQGQQVTGYPHQDHNNDWIFYRATNNTSIYVDDDVESDDEDSDVPHPVRHNDVVRVFHIHTKKFLLTHDVASPLTPTHQEVTCVDNGERYDETVWRIDIAQGTNGTELSTIDSKFKLVHLRTGVALHSHKGKYGEWGFGQQEINGNKGSGDKNNIWMIENVSGSHAPNKARSALSTKRPGFWAKFTELQFAMLKHNAELTASHPFQSSPLSWPLLTRGISFWINDTTKDAQIYLLGNPMVWWMAIIGVCAFMFYAFIEAVATRRGYFNYDNDMSRRLQITGLFFITGWALHYWPFFIMGRALFLHHYLPAAIYSFLVFAHIFDLALRLDRGYIRGFITVVLLAMFFASYIFFSPITYGTTLSKEDLVNRKWLQSWDLSFVNG